MVATLIDLRAAILRNAAGRVPLAVDPSPVVPAIAYGALVTLGARSRPVPALVGLLAAALTLLATSALGTLAGGLLAPGSRRGRDAGTVVLALAVSIVTVAGTLLPVLTTTLTGAPRRC